MQLQQGQTRRNRRWRRERRSYLERKKVTQSLLHPLQTWKNFSKPNETPFDQGMTSQNMLHMVFPGLLGQFSCVWHRWNPLSSSLGGLNLHRSCVIYMHAVICSPALPLHPILNVPGAQRAFLLNHHPPLQAWNQSIIHAYLHCEFIYVKLQLINLFL